MLTPKATISYVAQLELKTNQSTAYTKTETNNLLTPKATVAYVDAQLVIKANQSTTYTKTEVDNKLTLKLDSSALIDYYTKSYVDTALAGKQPMLNMLTTL